MYLEKQHNLLSNVSRLIRDVISRPTGYSCCEYERAVSEAFLTERFVVSHSHISPKLSCLGVPQCG